MAKTTKPIKEGSKYTEDEKSYYTNFKYELKDLGKYIPLDWNKVLVKFKYNSSDIVNRIKELQEKHSKTEFERYKSENKGKEVFKRFSSFKGIPKDYWLVGIRAIDSTLEKNLESFGDLFYLMKDNFIVAVTIGTSHPSLDSIKKATLGKANPLGCAMIVEDEWYQDVWQFGIHNSAEEKRMRALIQLNDILVYRIPRGGGLGIKKVPVMKNGKEVEESVIVDRLSKDYPVHVTEADDKINFHTVTYKKKIKEIIANKGQIHVGEWSQGCAVMNIPQNFFYMLKLIRMYEQEKVSFCLLEEFDPTLTRKIKSKENTNKALTYVRRNDIKSLGAMVKRSSPALAFSYLGMPKLEDTAKTQKKIKQQ